MYIPMGADAGNKVFQPPLGPKHSSPDWESAEKAQDMLHAFPTDGLARHREFSQELTLRLS